MFPLPAITSPTRHTTHRPQSLANPYHPASHRCRKTPGVDSGDTRRFCLVAHLHPAKQRSTTYRSGMYVSGRSWLYISHSTTIVRPFHKTRCAHFRALIRMSLLCPDRDLSRGKKDSLTAKDPKRTNEPPSQSGRWGPCARRCRRGQIGPEFRDPGLVHLFLPLGLPVRRHPCAIEMRDNLTDPQHHRPNVAETTHGNFLAAFPQPSCRPFHALRIDPLAHQHPFALSLLCSPGSVRHRLASMPSSRFSSRRMTAWRA